MVELADTTGLGPVAARCGGSSPSLGTIAALAQQVEHLICNQRVGSSNLSSGTSFGDIAQLGERLPCTQKVRGSTPRISTIQDE